MNKKLKNKIIKNGLHFLKNQQQKDGSFLSLSSPDAESFSNPKIHHTTFTTSIILSALTEINDFDDLSELKKKAASFLLKQKSSNWSYNYWTKGSDESKKTPYPDDLDDTFCALSALLLYDQDIFNGNAYARITNLLTALEKKEGGPYKTWLVSENAPASWKDVDLAVNCNIAYFLSLGDIQLPNLSRFIKNQILQDKITSPYYPSFFPILYFASRFLCNSKNNQNVKSKIQKILLEKRAKDSSFGNDLNKALAITTLLNIGCKPSIVSGIVDELVKSSKDNKWKPAPFYNDPEVKNVKYYAGSYVLTTALCIEAINKYLSSSTTTIPKQNAQKIAVKEKQIQEKVKKELTKYIKTVPPPLKALITDQIKLIFKRDKQIVLMPFYFSQSLDKKVLEKVIVNLGAANALGWIAYTIYDDFLDGERESELLSVANFSLRKLTDIFLNLLTDPEDFNKLFHEIMDKVDNANTWETSNARFHTEKITNLKLPDWKDFDFLANRSLGHALGPCALLFSLGYEADSLEIKTLMRFFKHFLIARQLNDDIHDWQEDFQKGHLTPVVTQLIKEYKTRYTKGNFQEDEKLLSSLQELFMKKTIVHFCEVILCNVKSAKEELSKLEVVKDKEILIQLLSASEQGALATLSERKKSVDFLKEY